MPVMNLSQLLYTLKRAGILFIISILPTGTLSSPGGMICIITIILYRNSINSILLTFEYSTYQVITLSTIARCSVADRRKYIRVVSILSCPIKSAKREMSLYFSIKFLANLCLNECG